MKRATVLLLATATAAVAQNRDTLETKLSAEGVVVLLEWSKKHPWDAEMAGQGAALVAEYQTATRGLVSEVLVTARGRGPGQRMIRFRLPGQITSPAAGPVCLFVQLPNRRVLPIRRANNKGDDTARFRYEAWEGTAARRAALDALKLKLDAAERTLAVKRKDVETQQSIVAKAGWDASGGCGNVKVPEKAALSRPFDALPPDMHDDVARQVCVRRVWYGEDVLTRLRRKAEGGDKAAADGYARLGTRLVRSPVILAALAEVLRKGGAGENAALAGRLQQSERFHADWTKWSPSAPNYRRPHFGEPDDLLSLQSAAGDAGERLLLSVLLKDVGLEPKNALPPPSATDLTGYFGGSIEAYFRCVEDGKKQLKTKLESWQALEVRQPEMSRMAQAELTRACERELGLLNRLRQEVKAGEEELVRSREALRAAEAPAAEPGSSGALVLNAVACSPK